MTKLVVGREFAPIGLRERIVERRDAPTEVLRLLLLTQEDLSWVTHVPMLIILTSSYDTGTTAHPRHLKKGNGPCRRPQ